jgi:plastocyanin
MSKCVRQLLPPAALLTLLCVVGCELFPWFGPKDPVPTLDPKDANTQQAPPDPIAHTVVISGDLSTAVFSPDTVWVYPGDQIVWLHENPRAGLIIHLDTVPANTDSLEIPRGECGRVTVDLDAPVGDYKYDVTVLIGADRERFDPRVAVRARPSQDGP